MIRSTSYLPKRSRIHDLNVIDLFKQQKRAHFGSFIVNAERLLKLMLRAAVQKSATVAAV